MKRNLVNLFLFIASVSLLSIVTDVEPLIDLTDLNILSLLLLIFSLFLIVFDNIIRLSLGQSVDQNYSTYKLTISYVVNLLLYFLTIWFLFFLHIMTPLNFYLSSMSFIWYNYLTFSVFTLIPVYLVLFVTTNLSLSVFKNINNNKTNKLFKLFVVYTLWCFLMSLVDSSSTDINSNPNQSTINSKVLESINTKSSMSYKNCSLVFDWHEVNLDFYHINFLGLISLLFNIFFFIFVITVYPILLSFFSDNISSKINNNLKVNSDITLKFFMNFSYYSLVFVVLSNFLFITGFILSIYLNQVYSI
jgi:hypothetical protein